MRTHKFLAFLCFIISLLMFRPNAELFALWGIFWLVGAIVDKPEKAQITINDDLSSIQGVSIIAQGTSLYQREGESCDDFRARVREKMNGVELSKTRSTGGG